MKTTTFSAALLTATTVCGQTDADTKPSALGVSEGDPVPADARPSDDEGGVLRVALLSGVAGLDDRAVAYTEKQGICKVVGSVNVENPRGDNFGSRHKAAVDELVARVKAKLNASPTDEWDVNADTLFDEPKYWLSALRRGNAAYAFGWEDDAAAPFASVMVGAEEGQAIVAFEFANFKDCVAEQDAADAAAF